MKIRGVLLLFLFWIQKVSESSLPPKRRHRRLVVRARLLRSPRLLNVELFRFLWQKQLRVTCHSRAQKLLGDLVPRSGCGICDPLWGTGSLVICIRSQIARPSTLDPYRPERRNPGRDPKNLLQSRSPNLQVPSDLTSIATQSKHRLRGISADRF